MFRKRTDVSAPPCPDTFGMMLSKIIPVAGSDVGGLLLFSLSRSDLHLPKTLRQAARALPKTLRRSTRELSRPQPNPWRATEEEDQGIGAFVGYLIASLSPAPDSESLSAEIDALLEDERYRALRRVALQHVRQMAPAEPGDVAAMPDWFLRMGREENREHLLLIDRLAREQAKATANIVEWQKANVAGAFQSDDFAKAVEEGGPLWFLTEPRFPVKVKEALFASIRVEPCIFALAAAGAAKAPPWVISALLTMATESLLQSLRFLAGMPGAAVSEDIIVPAERLDLDQVYREHAAQELLYCRDLAAARDSNLGIFPAMEITVDGS